MADTTTQEGAEGTDLDLDEGTELDSDAEGVESTEDLESEERSTPEDELGDEDVQKFTVKVDGEELEVTLEELVGGYQRQADYTRKTQELSADKRRLEGLTRLEEAFAADPQGTLEALATAYGVNLASGNENSDTEELDPIERELRELQSWRASQETRARQEAVEAELAAVKSEYSLGDDFDDGALFEFAIKNQIPSLDVAYRAMSYEQRESAKDERREEVTRRKRQAPKVEGGARRPQGATTAGSSKLLTIDEAFAAAKSELTS